MENLKTEELLQNLRIQHQKSEALSKDLEKREEELKKALQQAQETAIHLERTNRLAKIGGWELNLKTGEVHLTEEAKRLHDIDEDFEPLKYSTGSEWYPPEVWPRVKLAVQNAIENAQPYDLESPFITAKGRRIWVRLQGFPLVNDGKVEKLQGTFHDITDQIQARNQLRESEQLWKFAIEGNGDGVWSWEVPTSKVFFSKAWKEMLGFEEHEIQGSLEEWSKRVHPDDMPKVMADISAHFEKNVPYINEHRVLCKDGTYKWILDRGMVVSRAPDGKPIKVIGTHTDLSRIKAAEEKLLQSSRLASLGEISAGIAHEINNPLAIIEGSASLLTRFLNNPEKLYTQIEAIKKSCHRISKIIMGLKKYSRSGDKLEHSNHALCAIVRECLVLTEHKAKRELTALNVDCQTHAEIFCNEVEIEQVIINLISNAIDAAKEQSDRWVKVFVFDDSNEVVLRVVDSGRGITQEVESKLFDPFFTTKKVGEGTGLGLSITKGILESHHASIQVLEGSENTCFEVRFARALANNAFGNQTA
jgi:PAS domain S-box-containing protein